MSLTPLRQQYPFDSSGLKYKSMSDIMRIRTQWETFERVENYNDIVYQKLTQGNRTEMYYQFRIGGELNDYRNGQQLHVLKFPNLPPSTFDSISDRPLPNVTYTTPPPYVSQTIKQNAAFQEATSASEQTEQVNDLTIYTYVSTYNNQHTHQYIFPSNEEKIAYQRAQRLLFS
jgi:hypothetical protein